MDWIKPNSTVLLLEGCRCERTSVVAIPIPMPGTHLPLPIRIHVPYPSLRKTLSAGWAILENGCLARYEGRMDWTWRERDGVALPLRLQLYRNVVINVVATIMSPIQLQGEAEELQRGARVVIQDALFGVVLYVNLPDYPYPEPGEV